MSHVKFKKNPCPKSVFFIWESISSAFIGYINIFWRVLFWKNVERYGKIAVPGSKMAMHF